MGTYFGGHHCALSTPIRGEVGIGRDVAWVLVSTLGVAEPS